MLFIGVDVGGTKIAAGIVDSNGNLFYKESVPTVRSGDGDSVASELSDLVNRVKKHVPSGEGEVRGIGIGLPATINTQTNEIEGCNYVPLKSFDLKRRLREKTGLPVRIENDGNAAAYAEYAVGNAKGLDPALTITLGTGVGGGIVINGEIFHGYSGSAMEVGHMVIQAGGSHCVCGRSGCWEEYSSATALIESARKAALESPDSLLNQLTGGDVSRMDAKIPFLASKAGDPAALKLVGGYARHIADGLENLIVLFQPQIILIGGGISNEGEYLIEPIRDIVYRDLYEHSDRRKCPIMKALFGNDAGVIGAALQCILLEKTNLN